jgi:hypothetical protein
MAFLRDIVCLRNICINTLHKGDSNDDDDDNNNNSRFSQFSKNKALSGFGEVFTENYFHYIQFSVSKPLTTYRGLRATSRHSVLSHKNVTPLRKATSSTPQSYRDLSQQKGPYVFKQTPDVTPGQFIATPRVYRTVKLKLSK